MNKNMRIAAGAALAAVIAYPGAAWLLGMRLESRLGEQYQALEAQGMVKIISRSYQRGLYGASETVSFETTPGLEAAIRAGLKTQAPSPDAPLRFSVKSQIQHGPFPGGKAFGAAAMHSELLLEGEAGEAALRLFGKRAPVLVESVFGFFGGGRASLSSSAVSTRFKNEVGEQVDLVWQGLQLKSDFSAGLKTYSLKGTMPGLQIKAADGFSVKLSALDFSAEGERILGEESELYAGWTQVSLGELELHSEAEAEAGKRLSLKKLTYRVDMPLEGDFLDLRARLGAESFKVAEDDYGPAHYDFSVRHLSAQAMQGMQQSVKQLYADPARAQAAQSDPAVLMAAMRAPLSEILKQQPVFSLDRLAFRNTHGETSAKGELKLMGAEEADFSNPFSLISKLDLQVEISTPEKNAFALAGMRMPAQDAEQIAARDAIVQQQIESMIQQGYIERSASQIKCRLVFNKGGLTLNGRPMLPRGM